MRRLRRKLQETELTDAEIARYLSEKSLAEIIEMAPRIEAIASSLDDQNNRNHYIQRIILAWGREAS